MKLRTQSIVLISGIALMPILVVVISGFYQYVERKRVESDFRTMVSTYTKALADKDWKDLTHTLKGSARAVGAWRVAEAAERAEPLAGEALASSREAGINDIDTSLRAARCSRAIRTCRGPGSAWPTSRA